MIKTIIPLKPQSRRDCYWKSLYLLKYSPGIITGILEFVNSFLFRVIITSASLSMATKYCKLSLKSLKSDAKDNSIALSSKERIVTRTLNFDRYLFASTSL